VTTKNTKNIGIDTKTKTIVRESKNNSSKKEKVVIKWLFKYHFFFEIALSCIEPFLVNDMN